MPDTTTYMRRLTARQAVVENLRQAVQDVSIALAARERELAAGRIDAGAVQRTRGVWQELVNDLQTAEAEVRAFIHQHEQEETQP